MKNFDETEWARTKSLLREHLTAPDLEHPGLRQSTGSQEIERLRERPRPAIVSAALAGLVGSSSHTMCRI